MEGIFLRVKNINSLKVDEFLSLFQCSSDFKSVFRNWVDEEITRLEWCFVVESDERAVGGVIYGALDDELTILSIYVDDLNDLSLNVLLENSLRELKSQGFKKVVCHIYSDKTGYERYIEKFLENGFCVTQEKKSYVWNENIINERKNRLIFKNLNHVTEREYIAAIEQVTIGTLDKDDLDCVKDLGSEEAAINYFNQLKDIDFNKEWWLLAYDYNGKLVGLVVPQKFADGLGAINYIGIVPSERGRLYSRDLLIEGIKILNNNNVEKIIADIDINNYPLEDLLVNEGFDLSCTMKVLKLNF